MVELVSRSPGVALPSLIPFGITIIVAQGVRTVEVVSVSEG
jgi:hypothetical protein